MPENENPSMDNPADRRRNLRVTVDVPIHMAVIMPEQTFSPAMTSARLFNLSENGMLIEAVVTPDIYTSLLQKVRYCRVDIDEPQELACRIIGRAVWIRPQHRGNQTVCHLGLYFDSLPDEIRDRFRAYIAQVSPAARVR